MNEQDRSARGAAQPGLGSGVAAVPGVLSRGRGQEAAFPRGGRGPRERSARPAARPGEGRALRPPRNVVLSEAMDRDGTGAAGRAQGNLFLLCMWVCVFWFFFLKP